MEISFGDYQQPLFCVQDPLQSPCSAEEQKVCSDLTLSICGHNVTMLGVTGNVKTAAEEGDSAEETVDLSKVCSGLNYFQNGEDPPIRDDSDYPDWLRGILEPVKSPEELSPDSKAYWRRLNKQKARKNNFISKQLGR